MSTMEMGAHSSPTAREGPDICKDRQNLPFSGQRLDPVKGAPGRSLNPRAIHYNRGKGERS